MWGTQNTNNPNKELHSKKYNLRPGLPTPDREKLTPVNADATLADRTALSPTWGVKTQFWNNFW